MVQYLHFRILKFPLNLFGSSKSQHGAFTKKSPMLLASQSPRSILSTKKCLIQYGMNSNLFRNEQHPNILAIPNFARMSPS
jgi:hypothetical protein